MAVRGSVGLYLWLRADMLPGARQFGIQRCDVRGCVGVDWPEAPRDTRDPLFKRQVDTEGRSFMASTSGALKVFFRVGSCYFRF